MFGEEPSEQKEQAVQRPWARSRLVAFRTSMEAAWPGRVPGERGLNNTTLLSRMVLEWGPRPLQPPTGEQTVWLVVEVVEGVGSWAVWSFGVDVAFLTLSIIHLFQCLWCNTNKACLDYPVTKILPPGSLCKLSSARWGVCWGKSLFSLASCKISAILKILVVLY